ncbi:MAG: hypothetical protein ACKESB_00200 [Candidatus Hodgkinia cicadicola]
MSEVDLKSGLVCKCGVVMRLKLRRGLPLLLFRTVWFWCDRLQTFKPWDCCVYGS